MTTRVQFGLPALSDPAFRGLPRGLSGHGWFARLRAVRARWRERQLLAQLDDRMLKDIGISRSEAAAEAAKPFWRR